MPITQNSKLPESGGLFTPGPVPMHEAICKLGGELARIILDQAMLAEGRQLKDAASYVQRLPRLLLELAGLALVLSNQKCKKGDLRVAFFDVEETNGRTKTGKQMRYLKVLFCCLAMSIALAAQAKDIDLVAEITYHNQSSVDLRSVKHSITIPEERFYQKLVRISFDGLSENAVSYHQHKSSDVRYAKLALGELEARGRKTVRVRFSLRHQNLNTDFAHAIERTNSPAKFLGHTPGIEVNAREIKALAYLLDASSLSIVDKLSIAFSFPARYLNYQVQKKTSALTALRLAQGDCTEFAMLFAALSRSLGVPARMAAVFYYEKRNEFGLPNHHIAEIYTKKYGWMPVYPNLSGGAATGEYKFGSISKNIIFYKSDSWTWSRSFDPNVKDKDRDLVKTQINWRVDTPE